MKRSIVFATAIILLGACATKEIDFQTPVQDDIVFYASFEQPTEDGTRVYANEDLLLRWTADDRVSIFNKKTYNQQYQFTGETGDNAGGFRKVDTDEFMTGNDITNVVSVYPYQASTKISESEVISVDLPSKQNYTENTFGLGANTMVSVSADNFIQYKSVGGYLMLKLYGEGVSVSSITLKGNNEEKIAGPASVTMPLNGVPSTVMANNAAKEITLICATPVQLGATEDESKQFWFVVPPITFSEGFTITVNQYSGRTFEKSTSRSIAIERNNLSKMSPIMVENTIPDGNIVFEDVVAKYACVDKFDTDGDGEISYEEAATVTSLKGLFTDWNTVTKFDEIKFFTAVTSTAGVFNGLSKLESIIIPSTITTLGTFQGCSSLKTVVLPESISSLPAYCFDGCIVLDCLQLPAGLKTIGNYALRNCSALKSLILPDGITSIGNYAFASSGLLSITLPNSISSIGTYLFQNCQDLTTAVLPSGLTSLPNYMFYGCSSLFSITFPDQLNSIGNYVFYNCNFFDPVTKVSFLELPTSVKTIGDNNFTLLKNLFVSSSSSYVSISSTSISRGVRIFVPSSMLDRYKARTNWSLIADFIFPIDAYSNSELIPEAIDLGLSVKWASFNLGALSPEDYGDYYAWGEIDRKVDFSWQTYKWCTGLSYTPDADDLTKYNNKPEYGIVDNLTILEAEDDVATVKLGGKWRIPTYAEWQELVSNCQWSYSTYHGVTGFIVTSEVAGYTDRSIFLPAAGTRLNKEIEAAGRDGNYSSSTLYTEDPDNGLGLAFWSSTLLSRSSYDGRRYGRSIRPVYVD